MENAIFEGNLVTSKRIIYTPSSFAKSCLLYLQEAGSLKAEQQHTSRRENLNSYLFFTVQEGQGTLIYANQTYSLNAGDCVFIDCKKPYAHYTDSENLWKLSWVHFYGAGMSNIYDKYKERGGKPVLHPDNIDFFLEKIEEIVNTAESSEYVKDMMINEKISEILTQIMRESWEPESQRKISLKRQDLQMVKEYLDNNYTGKVQLTDLSDMFYINKFYLTRIFKEQYGCSIHNYLIQKRITKAKQLLRFSDESIENICEKCGINDENYFSRIFKKVEGVTPGEYRKIW